MEEVQLLLLVAGGCRKCEPIRAYQAGSYSQLLKGAPRRFQLHLGHEISRFRAIAGGILCSMQCLCQSFSVATCFVPAAWNKWIWYSAGWWKQGINRFNSEEDDTILSFCTLSSYCYAAFVVRGFEASLNEIKGDPLFAGCFSHHFLEFQRMSLAININIHQYPSLCWLYPQIPSPRQLRSLRKPDALHKNGFGMWISISHLSWWYPNLWRKLPSLTAQLIKKHNM